MKTEGKSLKDFKEKLNPDNSDYLVGYEEGSLEEIRVPISALSDKGTDGRGLQVQYSQDGVNYHYPYIEGDLYMRQRLGSDPWTKAIKIAIPSERELSPNPPADWWNLYEIMENEQDENLCYAILINNNDLEFSVAQQEELQGDYFKLSDGSIVDMNYPMKNPKPHVWDISFDKQCSEGYGTRYILVFKEEKDKAKFALDIKNFSNLLQLISSNIIITSLKTQFNISLRFVDLSLADNEIVADGSYQNCINLISYLLSPKTIKIGLMAFANCVSLIKLPQTTSLQIIEDKAFNGCRSLPKYLKLLDNIHTVGKYFLQNTSVHVLVVSNSISRFFLDSIAPLQVHSVKLPNRIEYVANDSPDPYSFTSLREIVIEYGTELPTTDLSSATLLTIDGLRRLANNLAVSKEDQGANIMLAQNVYDNIPSDLLDIFSLKNYNLILET